MSVHLSIESEQNIELSIPISTEYFFNRCWKEVAQKHQLDLIIAMQSGLDLDQELLEALLAEIKQLPVYIKTENFTTDDMEFFTEQLKFIITRLDDFLSEHPSPISGWVG